MSRPPEAPSAPVEHQRQLSATDASEIEDGEFDWKKIGIGAGALVVVASLLGVWAGSDAANDDQPTASQTVARAMLPPAKPFPSRIGEDEISTAAQSATSPPVSVAVASAPSKRKTRNDELKAPRMEQGSGANDMPPSQIAATDPLAPAAEQQPPQELVDTAVKAAAIPLPNRTIARTIERIGYACGQVASTDAVEGQAGVFTVSCTSGQSFQARPVSGRYRFKRLNR